jgi:hypothetical protein
MTLEFLMHENLERVQLMTLNADKRTPISYLCERKMKDDKLDVLRFEHQQQFPTVTDPTGILLPESRTVFRIFRAGFIINRFRIASRDDRYLDTSSVKIFNGSNLFSRMIVRVKKAREITLPFHEIYGIPYTPYTEFKMEIVGRVPFDVFVEYIAVSQNKISQVYSIDAGIIQIGELLVNFADRYTIETYPILEAQVLSGPFFCSVTEGQLADALSPWLMKDLLSEIQNKYMCQGFPVCSDTSVTVYVSKVEPIQCIFHKSISKRLFLVFSRTDQVPKSISSTMKMELPHNAKGIKIGVTHSPHYKDTEITLVTPGWQEYSVIKTVV